jgi:hypothetical protein
MLETTEWHRTLRPPIKGFLLFYAFKRIIIYLIFGTIDNTTYHIVPIA